MGDAAEESKPEENKPQFGVFLLPNGARYEGMYVVKPEKDAQPLDATQSSNAPASDGEEARKLPFRQGQGVYKLDGNVYEGEWVADRMHGRGLFKFMGGDSYDGDWITDAFHGQGRYQWKSGAYYIGAFENNKMHGDGTFTDTEGRQWKGRFYNGQGPGLHTLDNK